MQTVTVSFKNSRDQDQTETFDVYARNELSKQERMSLITANSPRVTFIGPEEWEDDDTMVVEKQAARLAGLDNQNVLVVRK